MPPPPPTAIRGNSKLDDQTARGQSATAPIPQTPPATATAAIPSSKAEDCADPAEKSNAAVFATPHPLNEITPVYPKSARRKGQEGDVSIAVTLDANGCVATAEVATSSGNPALDSAALDAARKARFSIPPDGAPPLPRSFAIDISFRLK